MHHVRAEEEAVGSGIRVDSEVDSMLDAVEDGEGDIQVPKVNSRHIDAVRASRACS